MRRDIDDDVCRVHQLEACPICLSQKTSESAVASGQRRTDRDLPQPWALDRGLREWQQIALEAWVEAGHRGVIEAATGTGKTMVALAAIELLRTQHGERLRVAVVVPTIALADQWRTQLLQRLHLRPRWVGELHSAAERAFEDAAHSVLITVLPTARDRLGPVLEGWSSKGLLSLLVVDECHRSGADANSRIFETSADFRLGLSATPERDDGSEESKIYPELGRPVFRYPLIKALDDDDILAPVISLNLYVDFDEDEAAEWALLADELGKALVQLYQYWPSLSEMPTGRLFKRVGHLASQGDPRAGRVVGLLAARRSLLTEASARARCLHEILNWLSAADRKAVVFHESIATAEGTYLALKRREVTVGIDHSGLTKQVRRRELDRYRNDRYRVFVAVRALDEGVDIPAADVAVISAGTRSRRQRIQRIGRILRAGRGKQALVVSILVRDTPEESLVGGRDTALLGVRRVRHHRWPERSLAEVLPDESGHCPPDSYRIHSEPREAIDTGEIEQTVRDLTIRELGLVGHGLITSRSGD